MGLSHLSSFLCLSLCCFIPLCQGVTWSTTQFFFVFGDSYSTDGYNVSAGVNSPNPGSTSSNGPNWVEYLSSTYNATTTKTFNLAYGGATIDSALVPQYLPTVLSIVDQVEQFNKYLAPKPPGAEWNSSNSLFAFWIGINDIGASITWTNITQLNFYGELMTRLFSQVEDVYDAGARSFLFLTVPPIELAPVFVDLGYEVSTYVGQAVADYNGQLRENVVLFQAAHPDLDQVTFFDTQPVLRTLLTNAETFGYVNITGYCGAYVNGTPNTATQIEPCAPVSNYFWLNTLHPVFTVHDVLAKAISTVLSTTPAGTY